MVMMIQPSTISSFDEFSSFEGGRNSFGNVENFITSVDLTERRISCRPGYGFSV